MALLKPVVRVSSRGLGNKPKVPLQKGQKCSNIGTRFLKNKECKNGILTV